MLSAPLALMFILGIWPQLIVGLTNSAVVGLIARFKF
jgi:hypothetical protein